MSGVGALWENLLSAALVGTDRRTATVPDLHSPLGTVIHADGIAGPGGLLDAAAALTVARRAGSTPATADAGEPAPDEARPVAPDGAVARLLLLLPGGGWIGLDAEQRMRLLREWLALAEAGGLRVPGRLLPDLLDLAGRSAELRPLVAAVGGERAGWLAALRGDWDWLHGTPDRSDADESRWQESQWHEGRPGERIAYLAALRERDPDAARNLLAESWRAERPEDRPALLAVLASGLAERDEEFCESALDDRRREVRQVAATLLERLPGSAYQRRMTDRALAAVRLAGGRVVVTPPGGYDDAMRRDGIEARPPRGVGERAWWMQEVVARTPLPAWAGLGETAAGVLARPIDDDWRPTLLGAWARAAVTQQDQEWASALAGSGQLGADPALYALLPPAAIVPAAIDALAGGAAPIELLGGCPSPWPDPLARAVLARLLDADPRPAARHPELADIAAFGIDPALASDVRRLAESAREDRPGDHRFRHLDRLATIVTIRHEMHQEFA